MTFSKFIQSNYEIHEWRHATAILRSDFPQQLAEIHAVLEDFRLRKSWIDVGGGRKSKVAEFIDSHLVDNGWLAKRFDTKLVVDKHKCKHKWVE